MTGLRRMTVTGVRGMAMTHVRIMLPVRWLAVPGVGRSAWCTLHAAARNCTQVHDVPREPLWEACSASKARRNDVPLVAL